MNSVSAILSADSLARIERECGKYPPEQRQSAVMAALDIAQDQHGWLSNEVMEEVAKVLGMAAVHVYEVATFYGMYNLKPVGKHKVVICTNLPCALSGALDAAEHLKRRLGVEFGETGGDAGVMLKEGECLGACGDAPVVLMNNKRMLCAMTPEKLDEFMKEAK